MRERCRGPWLRQDKICLPKNPDTFGQECTFQTVHPPEGTEEKTGIISIRSTGPMSTCRGDLPVLRHTVRLVLKQFVIADSSAYKLYKGGKVHNTVPLLKVKVKCSRYRPGVAQRVCSGIALLFHDRGTRRGWVVSSTPRPHFTPRERPGTHYTGGWVGPRAGLDGRKISSPPGFDPGPSSSSQSLYRLNYPAHTEPLLPYAKHTVMWYKPAS